MFHPLKKEVLKMQKRKKISKPKESLYPNMPHALTKKMHTHI